jgi:hypothetical protein
MYVDRSFSIAGFGTVVTGTLWSGSLGGGDRLRIEPAGRDVRVRSVQVHDEDVERAESGQRVAVSLPGSSAETCPRRCARRAGAYPVSYRLDVVLEEIEPIEDNARLRAHVGTDHVPLGSCVSARTSRSSGWTRGRRRPWRRLILRGETTSAGGRCSTPHLPRTATPPGWSSSSVAR